MSHPKTITFVTWRSSVEAHILSFSKENPEARALAEDAVRAMAEVADLAVDAITLLDRLARTATSNAPGLRSAIIDGIQKNAHLFKVTGI